MNLFFMFWIPISIKQVLKNCSYNFILFFLFTSSSLALENCRKHPPIGDKIQLNNQHLKITSTTQVEVPIDDQMVYLNALNEAETNAKLRVNRLLRHKIEEICEFKEINPDLIGINQKTKQDFCSILTESLNILSGSHMLSSCYEPGAFVRVSVRYSTELEKFLKKWRATDSKNSKIKTMPQDNKQTKHVSNTTNSYNNDSGLKDF